VSKSSAPRASFSLIAVAVIAIVAVAAAILVAAPAKIASPASHAQMIVPAAKPAVDSRVKAMYSAMPLGFEANEGQSNPEVKYLARGNGYRLFLTSSHAVMTVNGKGRYSEVLDAIMDKRRGPAAMMTHMKERARRRGEQSMATLQMNLMAPNVHPQLVADDLQPGKVNYFIGRDRSKWHSNIPLYGRVTYRGAYPGVDLAFHGSSNALEFDYLVSPGADASAIKVGLNGAQSLATNPAGDLTVSTGAGPVELHKPAAYQTLNGSRRFVDASFVVTGKNEVAFALGAYDHSRELVIDPTVTYSTYFGGSATDYGIALAVDGSGNNYVAGATDSATIPASSGQGGTVAPNNNGTGAGNGFFDTFVTKINPTGTCLFTTFFGGSSDDEPTAIAVDGSGIYVVGGTDSDDFPTSNPNPNGSVQTTYNGGGPNGDVTGYAVKLALSGGALVWGTYVEGNITPDRTVAYGVAVDSSHNLYIAGQTFSADLGGGAYKFLPNGGAINLGLSVGTYCDGFIIKLSSDGTTYDMVSYVGGSGADLTTSVALDSAGNIYLSGETTSTDFPVTPSNVVQTQCGTDGNCNGAPANPQPDAFAVAIHQSLSGYIYATYYGGSGVDDAFAITVDSSGDAFLTGQTTSQDFPLGSGTPYQGSLAGTQNAFVVELNPTATAATEATYFGGNGTDSGLGIALDNSSPPNVYLTGQTSSSSKFPLSVNALQSALSGNTDAFVSSLNWSQSSLLYSSYLGGGGDEDQVAGAIGLDSSQNIYVTGDTDSGNGSTSAFPTANALDGTYGGGGTCDVSGNSGPCTDAFIAAFSPATAPDFGLSASTPPAVSPGTAATSTVTLTAVNGYSSAVNLSCSVSGSGSPLPACSSTSFGTNPQTPSSGGATSTLSITTTGSSSAAVAGSAKIFYAAWLPIVGLSLVGMGFSTAGSRRKRGLGFLLLGSVMMMLFFLPACSSSSGTTGGGGCTGCTPAGSYTVTITGTGTDANTVTKTAQITVTVN
jgi:beta-propeller repeat-containing protein